MGQETIIGTWIDGKPIYKQVFSRITTGGSGGGNYNKDDIDISSTNFENIIKFDSQVVASDKWNPNGNAYGINMAYSLFTYITTNSSGTPVARFCNNQSWGAGYTAYITLYYTKKTD